MPPDPIFDKAFAFLLSHEGGFVDDVADPGGATKYGITLHQLQAAGHLEGLHLDLHHDGIANVGDIKSLSQEDAAEIYRLDWWTRYGFARVHDDRIAAKLLDLWVNVGPGEATRILQRAISAAWFPTNVTGKWDTQTLSSVNAVRPELLMVALKATQAGFYYELVGLKPTLEKFLKGWLSRAYSAPTFS